MYEIAAYRVISDGLKMVMGVCPLRAFAYIYCKVYALTLIIKKILNLYLLLQFTKQTTSGMNKLVFEAPGIVAVFVTQQSSQSSLHSFTPWVSIWIECTKGPNSRKDVLSDITEK